MKFGYRMATTLGTCLSLAYCARLSFLIGPGRFKELLFTARLMGAEEGYSTGLINEIVDAPEEVLSYARALALRIIQHAPLTIWAAKEALLRVYDKLQSADFFDVIEQCYGRNDFGLGGNSLIKRKTPEWPEGWYGSTVRTDLC